MTIISQGSFLGEAANRLYRALGLDGPMGIKTDDTIQPVVVIQDGTQPGMGVQRGRRFGGFLAAAGAAANVAYFTALEDVIIERVFLHIEGNAAADILNANVNIGGNVAAGTRLWPFLDRAASTSDLAPVVTTNGGTTLATFTGIVGTLAAFGIPAGLTLVTPLPLLDRDFFLAAGQSIVISKGLVGQIRGIVQGRTF